MSTDIAVPAPTTPVGGDGDRGIGAEVAIARQAFERLWVSAAVWALVFGATIAASALTYVQSFSDQASRDQLAATTGADTGLSILLGPISAIDTVGGYTVYKGYVFLTTIGAFWGLLTATRLLRGEEDAGRWQLVLAGATRASRATAATLSALGAGIAVVFVGTALITLVAGRDPDVGFGAGETVLYGLSIAAAPAVFAGVGALTSQLGRSRRVATGVGMLVLGVAFVLRMIADSSGSTRWLLWSTPFGWIERIRPLTDDDPWPLVLVGVAVITCGAAATVLAARRDVGAGVLASRDVAPPRRVGLRTPLGLAVRLELPVLVAWWAGAAVTAFALGVVGKVASGSVPSSIGDTLDRFGVHGSVVEQYFGVAFLLVATVVALLPASQTGAAADEETSGRLVHVLSQPIRRPPLLAGRLALGAVGIVAAGLLAGLAGWLGAETHGVHLGLGTMAVAGLYVAPTGLLVLAIGALGYAVAPRTATATVYAVVIWSVLVDLLGSIVTGVSWIDRLSLFHYMALAPAEDPEPATIAITLVTAIALCAAAAALFARRGVETG